MIQESYPLFLSFFSFEKRIRGRIKEKLTNRLSFFLKEIGICIQREKRKKKRIQGGIQERDPRMDERKGFLFS
jgi:hypothetical protein